MLPYSGRIRTYYEAPVLTFGTIQITRRQLTEWGCPFFRAARILSRTLHDHNISDVRQLERLAPADLRAIDGVGDFTLYVALHVIDAYGKGGAERWLGETRRRPAPRGRPGSRRVAGTSRSGPRRHGRRASQA